VVRTLADVQLAIEAVLGAEWEHWGNPRWLQGHAPKPEPCIPEHSVRGGVKALAEHTGRQFPVGQAAMGLAATEEGWCHLAPPGIDDQQ
jgi:hypothetical protein